MRSIVRVGFLIIALSALGLGALSQASQIPDPIQFHAPQFVVPPQVLYDDAGDGRCPDPNQPCLKDVKDLLYGRKHILRSDDLVITATQLGGAPAVASYATLYSANSNLALKLEAQTSQ